MKKILLSFLIFFTYVNANDKLENELDNNDTNQTVKIKFECDNNNSKECFNLGVLYHNGQKVKRDISKSFELFHKSCDLGYIAVCTRLALTYESNKSMRYDINKSVPLYEKSCENNSSRACERLGFIYEKGHEPFKVNHAKSVEYFMKTCELDDAACFKIGNAYETGIVLKLDINASLNFYKKSCDNNNTRSCTSLARIYIDQKNLNSAKKSLLKGCELKDGWSCGTLAKEFKLDINNTVDYLDKACTYGSRSACLSLGMKYLDGKMVKKDIEKSLKYLNSACDKAEAEACKEIANIYVEGKGINQNKIKSLTFLDKACRFGDKDSCSKYKK